MYLKGSLFDFVRKWNPFAFFQKISLVNISLVLLVQRKIQKSFFKYSEYQLNIFSLQLCCTKLLLCCTDLYAQINEFFSLSQFLLIFVAENDLFPYTHVHPKFGPLTQEQVIPDAKRENLIIDFTQQNFIDPKKSLFCNRIFQVSRQLKTKT